MNWKKYGMILGAIATTFAVIRYIPDTVEYVSFFVSLPETEARLNAKIHVYDSLHNAYEWRRKRADRYYTKFDSTVEILKKRRVL